MLARLLETSFHPDPTKSVKIFRGFSFCLRANAELVPKFHVPPQVLASKFRPNISLPMK
jgi:hypothetical protein